MEFKGKIIPVVIFLILSTGCGTRTSVPGTEDTLPPDPYGDPPGYSMDPFAGFGPVTTIAFPAEEDTIPIARGGAGSSWSVQIAACGSMEAAISIRDQVGGYTEESVFIDHIGSYYKVRVGSFGSSEETSALRERLRSMGYTDAWSVERETTP